jgi:hypothetical protein
LQQKMDNGWVGYWARPTSSGSYQYQTRRATAFVHSTGTLTVAPVFGAAIANNVTYELHRFNPDDKFSALDEARITAFPAVAKTVYDDTLTGDGRTRVFPIPAAVRSGPLMVMVEGPMECEAPWNFLTAPLGDSVTGYTATSTTASIVDRAESDAIIPRIGQSSTKLVTAASTAASYNMAIAAAENGLTAAGAADRKLTYARWVYCTEASKVQLAITDAGATTSGSFHGGAGWELLTVSATIAGNNTTTLTAVITIASTANASTIYVERGWFYYGTAERVRDGMYAGAQQHRVRRDDTTQQLYLDFAPPRGHQLRLIGQDTLSALGSTAASQATNTMEVDEETANLLCAEAARILYTRRGMAVGGGPQLQQFLSILDGKRRQAGEFSTKKVGPKTIRGMWR